jgi:RNA polymerase sigma-70 factor (ECF subfamily)
MSDELVALVASAQRGDRAAFDDLVRATYADIYTLAYRLTGHEEDAKDVVQDAYLRAYRGLKRFRGDANFTTWLYRITANCSATHLGRRNRNIHQGLGEVEMTDVRAEVDPEARADSAVLGEQLRRALAGLPPRLRSVIVLRDVYDLPHSAIATELGISEAAAKVRLHRARLRLREQLLPSRSAERAEDNARAV